MSLSATLLVVRLPSSNLGLYELYPNALNMQEHMPLHAIALELGKQLAHERNGKWYKPHGWEELTDPGVLKILEWMRKRDVGVV